MESGLRRDTETMAEAISIWLVLAPAHLSGVLPAPGRGASGRHTLLVLSAVRET